MERLFTFEADGATLSGVLHEPEERRGEEGVVICGAGLHTRAGPGRIYVYIARRLAAMGVPVLRFDFPGIGDSGGPSPAAVHFEMLPKSPTCKAVDALIAEANVKRVLVLGLCSGARNALYAAAEDDRVTAAVLMGLPVGIVMEGMSGTSGADFQLFARKAKTLAGWKRLLKFNVEDYKKLWRALMAFLRRRREGAPVVGPKIWEALDALSRRDGFQILLVYGTEDREYAGYQQFMEKDRRFETARREMAVVVETVQDGDHSFKSRRFQGEAIGHVAAWLERRLNGASRA